jgi:putative oxidoreductase
MSIEVDRSRLYVPALGALYERLAPYSYALVRFSAGAIMVPHGVQKLIYGTAVNSAQGMAAKGFPVPLQLAYLVGFVELFVAAAVAVGLFTRLAAAIIWIELLVILIWFVGPNGYFWGRQGYEFVLLWILLFTAIMFRGGGHYSVDRFMRKEF